MRDTTFFIFRNFFFYKITVSFTLVIKRSPGGEFAGDGRRIDILGAFLGPLMRPSPLMAKRNPIKGQCMHT